MRWPRGGREAAEVAPRAPTCGSFCEAAAVISPYLPLSPPISSRERAVVQFLSEAAADEGAVDVRAVLGHVFDVGLRGERGSLGGV